MKNNHRMKFRKKEQTKKREYIHQKKISQII